jgi:hypothetical protein
VSPPIAPRPAVFAGGEAGTWRIVRTSSVIGDGLPAAPRLAVLEDVRDAPGGAEGYTWLLRGVTGHSRYTNRAERTALDAISAPLGRPDATRAALIPIRKSAAWWALAQDERRAIFEERSRHIADTMTYLPAIARRLYHARELGEPFDFLTWFEYAPEHESAFEDLVAMLRSREEWRWVDREVDVRLSRVSHAT